MCLTRACESSFLSGNKGFCIATSEIKFFYFHFQDPEVQKHATQILRKMLEQEEAELQVKFSHIRKRLVSGNENVSWWIFP